MLSFLFQKENCVEIIGKLLSRLQVDVTYTTLKNDLLDHPDYPSLLSVGDVLTKYGVENISLKASVDQLNKMPLPCIAQIKSDHGYNDLFTVISTIKGDSLNYYHPEKHQWENITVSDFEKKWPSGIVLLADAEEAYGEKEFKRKRREEKRINIARYATFLVLPLLALFTGIWAFVQNGLPAGLPVSFLTLTLIGCIIGGLLLWYELDQYNPVLQQICSAGKKINCGAILNSKASKIGGISWSTIGFTYFAGSLFMLIILGISNPAALYGVAWLNTLAVPYVFFSVYYQWRVAKQWCVLCLCVQCLLVLQLFTALEGNWHTIAQASVALTVTNLISISLAFITPFIIVNLLLPAYRMAKGSKQHKVELQRLKHNPQIFEALLSKQKMVTESTEGLGILLGNLHAKHKIIKVCNPYCGPCAKAHTPMEELLENNSDIQIQIIFSVSNRGDDIKALPVKHLLAIADKKEETIIQKALDDWYLADKKDYDAFAGKFPMNGELKQQDAKIEAMQEWCSKTGILFTPTFFVNGYQLPEIYTVNDLKYFLSV